MKCPIQKFTATDFKKPYPLLVPVELSMEEVMAEIANYFLYMRWQEAVEVMPLVFSNDGCCWFREIGSSISARARLVCIEKINERKT